MRLPEQREVVVGFFLGAAAGGGFLFLEWFAGAPAASAAHQAARLAYVGVLGCAGAAVGARLRRAYAQSMTDPLTGLFNRRYFSVITPQWLARARRSGEPLSLLILDVDNFKAINDRFGHHEGDRVLQSVARVIRDSCRQSDVPVRWGGEEFAVLLPDTDAYGAEQAAARICRRVAELTGVTLSVGVATFPDVREDALVQVADRRMYEHKAGKCGRAAQLQKSASGTAY